MDDFLILLSLVAIALTLYGLDKKEKENSRKLEYLYSFIEEYNVGEFKKAVTNSVKKNVKDTNTTILKDIKKRHLDD